MDSASARIAAQVATLEQLAEHATQLAAKEAAYDAACLLEAVRRQCKAIHEMVVYDAQEEEEAMRAQLRMHDYEQHVAAQLTPPPF